MNRLILRRAYPLFFSGSRVLDSIGFRWSSFFDRCVLMAAGEGCWRLVRPALADGSSSTDLADSPPTKILRIGFQRPAHPVSKLGDDLLQEILIRLPNPRSTCRCKPVSKRWNSMLSYPSFNRCFVSHHKSRNEAEGEPPLLLPSSGKTLLSILSFLPVPDEIRSKFVIWDCFKDLLLCGFRELDRLFLICNPFTKQLVTLPLAPARISRSRTTLVKLVCKEARNNHSSLDLGDDQVFLYSEYRFRVLVEYQAYTMIRGHTSQLQVFCSKSREWSTENGLHLQPDAVVSLNGKLYEKVGEDLKRFDPFRQNISPTTIDDSLSSLNGDYLLSTSNGALYLSTIEFQSPPPNDHEQGVLRVRRWEEDRRTWTTCYGTLSSTLKWDSGLEVEDLKINSVLAQHSEKSEVLFLECFRNRSGEDAVVYSYDFRTRILEFVADEVRYDVLHCWMVFQPRTTCFSTPIPNYEKLLGMYNGIYSDLVQIRKST